MYLHSIGASTNEDKAKLFNQFFSVYQYQCKQSVLFIVTIELKVPDIFKALCSLNPHKAMSIDRIGPMVLKNCADALCVPVHHLFMTSLHTDQLPAEWKIHLVTPVFKKNEKSNIRNYRSISLLCSLSKAMYLQSCL